MGDLTNYAINKVMDALMRGQAIGTPASFYCSLLVGKVWTPSTAYASGDLIVTAQSSNNGRIYRCTTAGTSGASAPTWPTTDGGTVTDGTVTWTEDTPTLKAGTMPEVAASGGYARVAVAASLTAWAGTQGAGTTTASSGTSGTTSNNAAITFPSPTAAWQGTNAYIIGSALFDASTAGNAWSFGVDPNTHTVNNGDQAPSVPAGSLTVGLT